MLKLNPIQPRDLFSLLLILFVAAILRFGDAGVTEFFHDEAMLSILAQDMARGESLPTVGIISSVGIPNPPVSVYVVAIPYLFTDNPLIATLFIAALNVIGVGLLWFIAHRYFSPTVALIASLTYAVSPWAVLYSRKIWAQDFVVPFLLLAIVLGLLGFIERKRWAAVLCLPVLLFAVQIHFAAWALLPLYGFFILTRQPHQVERGRENDGAYADKPMQGRQQRMVWIATIVLSLLVLAPFAIGIAQTLSQDPTRISDAMNRSEARSGLGLSLDALRYTTYLATGLGVETWVAPNQQADLLARVPVLPTLWLIIGVLALVGLIGAWWRYRPLALLLTAWALLPLIVFTPTWTNVYPHYFIGAIPALALLSAIGLETIIKVGAQYIAPLQMRSSLPRTVLLVGFCVILATQAFWWRGLMRYVDTTEITLGEGTSGYTLPVHYMLGVRDAVAGFDDVVVLSDGMDVLFDVEPARWAVMLRDRCVRTLPADGFAVLPEGQFAAIIAPNTPPNDLYQTDDAQTYPARGGSYTVSVFETVPEWTEAEITSLDANVPFTNGVTLTGYALTEGRVYLEWALSEGEDTDYQYFIHLLDDGGEVISQRDRSFWSGRHWCAGDRLISWLDVETANASGLRIGFYTLGTGKDEGTYFPVDVLDAMWNPAGNWIDVAIE
jgi:4-amino-4-deoxy-L-arabinose transferase-like glycosyltransferase